MTDRKVELRVESREAGRVDKILAGRFPDASRAEIARLFRRGAVRLNGAVAKKGSFAAEGATIELERAPPGPEELRPLPAPELELSIVYEDDELLAVAKPAGMPSHPLRAGELGTAANALVALDPRLAHIGRDPREAGLIHRLDTGTSGVLVAARTQPAWEALRRALSEGRVIKIYEALVSPPLSGRGSITALLGQRGGRAVVSRDGRPAQTDWEVVKRAGDYALVRCVARTGRMHQIRAHLAHAGAPIVGDEPYGGRPADDLGLTSHFLHASAVTLSHPATGEPVEISAPFPADRIATLRALGLAVPSY